MDHFQLQLKKKKKVPFCNNLNLKVFFLFTLFFTGKFQMQVLPQCGHAVHEDVPDKVSYFLVTHAFSILHIHQLLSEDEKKFRSCLNSGNPRFASFSIVLTQQSCFYYRLVDVSLSVICKNIKLHKSSLLIFSLQKK